MRCVVEQRSIFDDLSLCIARGEIVDIVGPSGVGKSSLLTALAQLNPHATGDLALHGQPASTMSMQEWRERVSYLPQKPVFVGETVLEAIQFPWTLAIRRERKERFKHSEHFTYNERFEHTEYSEHSEHIEHRQIRELHMPTSDEIRVMLDAIGCADVDVNRPIHDISGGQAARVSLARTLLTKPQVILADEVDAGLDDDNAELVANTMAQAAAKGIAIIRIRHRPPDGRASRILRLEHGQLLEVKATYSHRDGQTSAHTYEQHNVSSNSPTLKETAHE